MQALEKHTFAKAHASPAQTVPALCALTTLFPAINTLVSKHKAVQTGQMSKQYETIIAGEFTVFVSNLPCHVACKAHSRQECRTSPRGSRISPRQSEKNIKNS